MKTLISCHLLVFFFCNVSFPQSDSTGTVTDIDGNVYKTVKIGDQWWMAENLKVTHYRSGEAISNITDIEEWSSLSTGAYCSYDNADSNISIYGLLYNWFAVLDSYNIAPAGWHVPSDAEWQALVDYLGGDTVAGGKMKATGTIEGGDGLWHEPNEGATNESGFSALPGGCRLVGTFTRIGDYAYFWSSSTEIRFQAWYRYLNYGYSGVVHVSNYMQDGYSVRCVKDQGSSSIESKSETLKIFELFQNYPNPFNPVTTIEFSLPKSEFVELKIYNILGKKVSTLVSKRLNQGNYTCKFDGTNFASGIYYYQLVAGDYREVKKMILLR